jgi:hypothetical protein
MTILFLLRVRSVEESVALTIDANALLP